MERIEKTYMYVPYPLKYIEIFDSWSRIKKEIYILKKRNRRLHSKVRLKDRKGENKRYINYRERERERGGGGPGERGLSRQAKRKRTSLPWIVNAFKFNSLCRYVFL